MKTTASPSLSNKGLRELRKARRHWQLVEDGPPFCTASSVLQYVFWRGEPACLKIALCEEERRGAALLRWWSGESAVRVLAFHDAALLLERACGERSLIKMSQTGQDDEASRIICSVADSLHRHAEANVPELVPLSQWFKALRLASRTRGGIFQTCAEHAAALLATPQEVVALH